MLDPDLLLKLERVLYAVRRAGVDVQTLSVLSGFRTPAYNAAIGNETSYSRHLYGDAADVFVDADGDGQMDDVTGDGEVTRADAEWMAELVGGSRATCGTSRSWAASASTARRRTGPFIHVDTRGEPVRW